MNPSKLRFSFGASLQRACSFAVVDKIMQIRLTGLSSVPLKGGESAPKLVHLLRSFKEGMRKAGTRYLVFSGIQEDPRDWRAWNLGLFIK